MSKYIDADRLQANIKEIENELKTGNYYLDNSEQAVGYSNALMDFEQLVLSLQQEQDILVINKKDWEAQEKFRKNKDFGKPLQHEQQDVDLDADIEMEWDSFNKHLAKYGEESEDVVWLNWNSFDEIAHHFYELGLSARKEK